MEQENLIESNATSAFNHEDISNLNTAAKWAKFLGIIFFIFLGLIGVALIFMIFGGLRDHVLGTITNLYGYGFLALYIVVMIGIMILYFFLAKALYVFGTKTKVALLLNNPYDLSIALKNLKIYFAITGIVVLVIVIIYVIAFLFSIGMYIFN